MSVPASPFAGRLLSEIARSDGGLPAACAEMGVTPQDIDAIAGGRMTSALILAAAYEWLDARVALEPGERDDYDRLRAEAIRHPVAAAAGGLPDGGQSIPPPAPPRPGGRTRILGTATAAVVIVILIVVGTVLLTVMIVLPGRSRTTAGSGSPPTNPPTSLAPVGETSPPAPLVSPSPSPATSDSWTGSGGAGLIASYDNYKLPCGDGIAIGPGGPPAPTGNDLSVDCSGDWSGNGNQSDQLGLLTGQPTYASCAKDTVVGSSLTSVAQGDTICVQGNGTIALATLVGSGSAGGISYVTLDVRVWRDPGVSGGN